MRKLFFIGLMLTAFVSCEKEGEILYGNFIYYEDAAVLETPTEIYGVVIDAKMHELDKQVKAYKKDETDMVPVEIRGRITPKAENEEGWPFRVEILEILSVSKPNSQDTNPLKLEK